jgi:hypothetical protein
LRPVRDDGLVADMIRIIFPTCSCPVCCAEYCTNTLNDLSAPSPHIDRGRYGRSPGDSKFDVRDWCQQRTTVQLRPQGMQLHTRMPGIRKGPSYPAGRTPPISKRHS